MPNNGKEWFSVSTFDRVGVGVEVGEPVCIDDAARVFTGRMLRNTDGTLHFQMETASGMYRYCDAASLSEALARLFSASGVSVEFIPSRGEPLSSFLEPQK